MLFTPVQFLLLMITIAGVGVVIGYTIRIHTQKHYCCRCVWNDYCKSGKDAKLKYDSKTKVK